MQSNRCRVLGSFLAVLSIRPYGAAAQQITVLTAMDYVEIQQLVNRLNVALDDCTNGSRDFADLFVEGGQFAIDQVADCLTGAAVDCAAISTDILDFAREFSSLRWQGLVRRSNADSGNASVPFGSGDRAIQTVASERNGSTCPWSPAVGCR